MYLRPQQKKPAKEHDNVSVHAPLRPFQFGERTQRSSESLK